MLKGLGNLGDLGKLMAQAREMQEKMQELQQRMETLTAEGSSGAGMVKAVANAKGKLTRLEVDPALFSGEEDKAVLEDLIVAAVNDAQEKAVALGQQEMAKLTQEMGLPAGILPGM
jgi:DNA-binding YbaB/EbfC family protein